MKTYRYTNHTSAAQTWARIEPELRSLSREYGLKVERTGERQVRLTRSGVEVQATVTDTEVVVGVDLALALRIAFGGTIEAALDQKIPPLLEG